MRIREDPRPGDIGAVIRMHGVLYAEEYGLDASFEAMVAARLAELTLRGWPAAGEGLWMVDADGEPAGSITLAAEDGGLARLGHFLLLPEARGHGPGPGSWTPFSRAHARPAMRASNSSPSASSARPRVSTAPPASSG